MTLRYILAAIALVTLGACGGGGGESTGTVPPQAAVTTKSAVTADLAPASSSIVDTVLTKEGSEAVLRPLARSPLGLHGPVTFSPSPITGNQVAGISGTYVVTVKVGNAGVFNGDVYATFQDGGQMMSQARGLKLLAVDATTYVVTLPTSASLPAGRYQGASLVLLCRDANCVQQYPGSPTLLAYDINISPKPLLATPLTTTSATAYVRGASPPSVSVQLSGPSATWTATTSANWLKIDSSTGTLPATLKVRYDIQGQGVGHYEDRVLVSSSDGQRTEIGFALEMLPEQFTVSSNALTFVGVNGSTIPAQTLNFGLSGPASVDWTATASAPWLLANPSAGTTPGSLTASVDPSRSALPSGTHSASILLQAPGYSSKTVPASLSLTRPTLSAPSTVVTLGGPKGRDEGAQSISMSLNTGQNKWPWTIATLLPVWASASPTSGTVDATGTTVGFMPAPDAAPGSYSAVATLSARVNGDNVTLPVTLNLNRDKRKLLPAEWAVGFASTPAGSVLTKTLQINDNFGGTLPWTASSSASWLSVTQSGTTGSGPGLTLSANPALAPTGVMSHATVTLQTSASNVDPVVLNVGLWRSAEGLTTVTSLPIRYSHVVADKLRPYVYAHNGGTFIDVYNAHLGTKIGTIPNAGAALGEMTVTPDGSRLYALDTANNTAAVIDLFSMAKTATWTLDSAAPPPARLLALRTNGKDIVLADGRNAYVDGQRIAVPITGYGNLIVTATANGRRVFAQDTGVSPASVSAYDIDYSAMANGTLMVNVTAAASFINRASNGQDIAVNADGSALYTASGAPYRCSSVNPANLVFIGSLPGGDAYPNNVEVTSDGRVICGISGWYSDADMWVHAPNGALLKSFKLSGYARSIVSRQLVVTPDGMTAVALTDDPRMVFVPIGAP